MFACSNISQKLHTLPSWHPEQPLRIAWAEAACREAGVPVQHLSTEDLAGVPFEDAIALVHSDARLLRLHEAAETGPPMLDTPECPVSPGTPQAALDSLRATLWALRRVLDGDGSGLCLARPPGHHSGVRHTMGFCYINNLAVAVHEAIRNGIGRVAVLDIDVHHGNGTQEVFYGNGDVFFCSLHEDPRYQFPGTGYSMETGMGEGRGATLNLPLLSGTGGAEFLHALEHQALPALAEHGPQLLLISAGFDTHRDDLLGGLRLHGPDCLEIGRLLALAVSRMGVPALLVLEGGYTELCFMDGLAPMLAGWKEAVSPSGSQAAGSADGRHDPGGTG